MGLAIRQFVIVATAVLAVTTQTATSAVESDVGVLQAPQISEQRNSNHGGTISHRT
jgi:hypothetical protein